MIYKANNFYSSVSKFFLLLCFSFFSAATLADMPVDAGKVVYGYGNNHAFDSDGNRRELKKGSTVSEGDTLVTSRGRLHIRLADGGFISIYPESKYKIEKFRFSDAVETDKDGKVKPVEDKKENRGFFSLLKGAARQVTGILGRRYNNNFKVKTSVATIGIRGTGFFARLCQADCFDANGIPLPDGLHLKNNTGIITMTTDAGSISLAQGQSAFAASRADVPVQVLQPPVAYNLITPDIELYDFDQQVPLLEKDVTFTQKVPPIGPPIASTVIVSRLAYVTSTSTTGISPLGGLLDTSNPLHVVGQTGDSIESFTGPGVELEAVFDSGTATLSDESGVDSTLGVLWNRWTGAFFYDEGTGSAVVPTDDNIHLIGSDNITANVPGSTRGIVTYVGTGGTSPTISGAAGTQVGSQVMTATLDYVKAELTSFQLDLTFSNATINANNDPTAAVPLTVTSGIFVPMTGTCFGLGCTDVTSAFVNGSATINMVGPNAEGIYGVFNLVTTDTGKENAVSGSYVATDTGGL